MPDVYLGCYLKVWMPTETISLEAGKCPVCQREFRLPYCSYDGAKIEFGQTMERPKDFHDYCETIFGDGDQFSSFGNDYAISDEYLLIVTNLPTQCGSKWADTGENFMPQEDWSGDWEKLIAALARDGIRYEKHVGVLVAEDW